MNESGNKKIEESFRRTRLSKTFRNIIRKYDLSNRDVLDIGCSNGEFLANFGNGSLGITISLEEAICGREKGLDIMVGNIESKDLAITKNFDVIFSNNLLEHLYSPHSFLYSIKKYLKPNGILILGVPCIPVIAPLVLLKKFRGSLAFEHINFFTRGTLIQVVKSAGWDVLEVRGFHFSNVLIDRLLDLIYPHFYVVASPKRGFKYHEKRLKELGGYDIDL